VSRIIATLAILGLAAGSALLPDPAPAQPGVRASVGQMAVSTCPVDEGSGRNTVISVVSRANGPGRLTAFAGGVAAGSAEFETGASGSSMLPVVEVAAVGVATGLVELPSVSSAAAAVVLGTESFAAEVCLSAPARQTLLAAGSTLSGQEFHVQLMNPYAGEAIVDVTVVSDSGLESTDDLESIIVPPRSSVELAMEQILPGREFLSLIIDATRGSIIPAGKMTDGSHAAIWNAVAGAQDWFVPLPTIPTGRQIVLSTASAAEVPYQIDVYGVDGLTEALDQGVIPGRGQVRLDVDALAPDASAVRVLATAPIGVFIRAEGEFSRGVTSGATGGSTRWLLPGALVAPSNGDELALLNPGTEDATVVITERRDSSTAVRYLLPADTAMTVSLSGVPADGVAVDSDFPIVALWMAERGDEMTLSIGVAVGDG
jgi:hypothetical protein